MATTPPPTRARTPPTPLHGPKYDLREPYSPRRSTRIGNKESKFSPNGFMTSSATAAPQSNRTLERPTPRKHANNNRFFNQSFSPPTSPTNAGERLPSPTSHRATTMLPTPAKTPRKRGVEGETKLNATARVLFPSRPSTVEEAMPTPRRSRKGRKHTVLSLDSLMEGAEHGGNIEIYTDSRDRVPEIDEDDDNPFMLRRSSRKVRPRGSFECGERSVVKTMHGMTKEVDEAVANGKGMVYVFRGKKIFRKFDELNSQHSPGEDDEDISDHDISRRAGATARQRLTRSSIKPRLLFPPKEPSPAMDHIDEEALTDIEGPVPETASESEEIATTPIKQQHYPTTPPTTGRKTRNGGISTITPSTSPRSLRSKRASPFNTWQRTKPAAGPLGPAKRSGEPMEKGAGVIGKRTRNGSDVG